MTNADVYKAGRLAARLIEVPGGVEFRYEKDYVASGAAAVASTLPISSEPRLTAAGAVPPYFAGLLPEGRRLTNLRRAVKTSADDELSLLLAVGADPVGDVQVVAEGTALVEVPALLTVPKNFAEVRFATILAGADIVDPIAIAGVQEKISGRVLSLPVSRAHERFILKLSPPEYPFVVENEAAFLALARDAKIATADAEIIRDADDRAGLLVTRFDRTSDRVAGGRRAVEDACQALDLWPADKYNVTMERAAIALIGLCAARPVAAREIFRQVLFAWLTGNGDVHAKNLSVLQAPSGEWRIAPAYDLPSTVPYRDTTFALSLQGKRSGFSRRHFLSFANEIGLPDRSARTAIDQLLEATRDLSELIETLPFDQATGLRTIRELQFRRKQLLDEG